MPTTLVETDDAAQVLVGRGYLQRVRGSSLSLFLNYEIAPDGKRLMENRRH